MSKPVKPGDQAPDFELPAAEGNSIRLSDYRGQSEVILFFYPKDDTPGCTAEACAFRDSYEAFLDAGAVVLGVSSDGVDGHRSFAGKHRLPFPLLSDQGGRLRSVYGVPRTLGLIPGRVTYVIDRQGVVRQVFSSQFNPLGHVKEALKALEQIKS